MNKTSFANKTFSWHLKAALSQALCLSAAVMMVGCANGESLGGGYQTPENDFPLEDSLSLRPLESGGEAGLVSDPINDRFTRLATDQGEISKIAVYGDDLNYFDYSSVPVLRTRSLSTGKEIRSIQLNFYPTDIAVNAGGLFLTVPGSQKIAALPHDTKKFDTVFVADSDPLTLAVEGDNLYWGQDDGCVYQGDIASKSVRRLTCEGGIPIAMAVDQQDLFWATHSGTLYKASQTGQVTKLISGENIFSNVVLDDTNLYWADDAMRAVRSLPRDGGGARTVVSDVSSVSDLAVDDDFLYASSKESGHVWSISTTTLSSQTLASDQDEPVSLVQDKDSLYWANESLGDIVRYRK